MSCGDINFHFSNENPNLFTENYLVDDFFKIVDVSILMSSF